jgi:hypothetical protein
MADKPPKSIVKEFGIFCIGMGVLLGAAAYFTLTGLNSGAPPLWGMQRNLAIGLPLGALALANAGSGIGLLTTRNKTMVTLSIVSGLAISIFYFFFMVSATGTVGINLLSALFLFLPLILLSRGSAATRELDGEAGLES